MKKTSWAILAVCALLCSGLGALYLLTQNAPKTFTQQDALAIVRNLQIAFQNKKSGEILAKLSPDSEAKLAKLTPDQIHAMLLSYFRNSDKLDAEIGNYAYAEGQDENTLLFDLKLHNDSSDSQKTDYEGRLTLHFKYMDTPRLFGLLHASEWRISSIETTGPDISAFGDN